MGPTRPQSGLVRPLLFCLNQVQQHHHRATNFGGDHRAPQWTLVVVLGTKKLPSWVVSLNNQAYAPGPRGPHLIQAQKPITHAHFSVTVAVAPRPNTTTLVVFCGHLSGSQDLLLVPKHTQAGRE